MGCCQVIVDFFKVSKAVLSFTATQTDPYDLQRLFLKPSPRLLYSKIAVFYKTEEKQVLLMIIFHRVMGCKSDIFGFGTSNMISRKDIMPVLASFKNLDIFSLSATLTHNGSSVGPGPPAPRPPGPLVENHDFRETLFLRRSSGALSLNFRKALRDIYFIDIILLLNVVNKVVH